MTDNKALFADGDNNGNNGSNTQTDDQVVDNYLDIYVGEGKKYASVEEALKGLHHSQKHIEHLEQETAGMRNDLKSRQALEELVTELKSSRGSANEESNNSQYQRGNEISQDSGVPNNNEGGAPITVDEINRLVEERLAAKETQSVAERNLQTVATKLEQEWGPGFRVQMRAKAQELGMSEEKLTELAGDSPQAVLRLVGADGSTQSNRQSSNSVSPPRNSVNTQAVQQSNSSGRKTWADFERMRKENPGQYWKPAVQNEIWRLHESGQLDVPSKG